MSRDAVSRTANVERNGGHKWVKANCDSGFLTSQEVIHTHSFLPMEINQYETNLTLRYKFVSINSIRKVKRCVSLVCVCCLTLYVCLDNVKITGES